MDEKLKIKNFEMNNNNYYCVFVVFQCLLLAFIYVISLYVWNYTHDRDNSSTIKKRFISVGVMGVVSPFYVWILLDKEYLKKYTLWQLMGYRTEGLLEVIFLPLLLTMVLFLGPLIMTFTDGSLMILFDKNNWSSKQQNLIYLRNYIVAPLSEENTFRACMIPLLFQCFSFTSIIIICPLFFGLAHFNHFIEQVRSGIPCWDAFFITSFQFLYTSIFGAYCAFIFLRTDHLLSVVIIHMFCNLMGFPDIIKLLSFPKMRKYFLIFTYIVGIVLFTYLLQPLTNPIHFSNYVYSNHS